MVKSVRTSTTASVSQSAAFDATTTSFTIPTINGQLNLTNATPTIYVDSSSVVGQIGLELNALLTTGGNVAINKTGAGVLGLGAQTSFSGGINVNQGTLAFGAANTFFGLSQVNLAANTILDTRGLTGTIGSLSGSGLVENYSLATTGTSLGGYHAMNLALRHPHLFGRCISLGGAFSIRRFLGTYFDQGVFEQNPPDYIAALEDPALLDQYRHHLGLVLAVGERDFLLDENRRFSALLHSKGIPHYLDVWGDGAEHDWPWWQRMAAKHF